MTVLTLDLETYSTIPIQTGSYKYSEAVEIMLFPYAVDDEPVQLWDLTVSKDMPSDLQRLLNNKDTIFLGHNIGGFDRIMLQKDLKIELPLERTHDTMACAYAHGLPGGLDLLCDLLKAPVSKAKSKEGKKLITLFCSPRKDGTRATRLTHPAEWHQFREYAKLDIEATRYIYKTLPAWNYQGFEHRLWCIDQKMNQNGFSIDTDLIDAAIRTVNREQDRLRQSTVDVTNGEVPSTTQRDVLLKYILEEYNVELPDMQASTLERRISDPELPEGLKELLAIRMQATTSSTAKYSRIKKSVSSDGRLRGTLQYCGASRTGRDAGRILNPQNLPRPTLPGATIEFGVEALKADCADLFFDNVMELASNTIRGVITAAPGKKLLVADLSNIEGRYAAWIADEKWKIKAFEDYDTIVGIDKDNKPIRLGHDVYKLAYAKSFQVKPEAVTKVQRDTIGKTMELALQFGGGCGAFVTFALSFGINLDDLVKQGRDSIPSGTREEAEDFWDYAVKQKHTLGLEKEVFVTCDSLKRMWRQGQPNIVRMWKDLEDAVRNAIESPQKPFLLDKLRIQREGNWLRIIQPSGRSLCYPGPRVSDKGEISFMGMDQYTRKFQRISTYGPKVFENVVQGGARDVFMRGVVNADETGYTCVMRIHDEQIDEVPDTDEFTVKELCRLMTTNIEWANGLPLAATGFESYRYKKAD